MTLTLRAKAFATELLTTLANFPWRSTAQVLHERFVDDRLGLTASSLTFTTTIALVPLLTVALAAFSAFPMFGKLQSVLQQWLLDSLIPDNISRQVMGYLTQFSTKASKLGAAGAAILMVTALALIFTIDRTLNAIWRVRVKRPFGQRLLVYWAAITLGPLLLAASLTLTTSLLPMRGLSTTAITATAATAQASETTPSAANGPGGVAANRATNGAVAGAAVVGSGVVGGGPAITSSGGAAGNAGVPVAHGASVPAGLQLLIDALQFVLLAAGMAALYHYVPNTQVKWAHAWCGGIFVALGIEIAKRLLTLYLAKVPTYAMVYGAFATAPILLTWIYLVWVIVLLGSVIAAYLPSLLAGVTRKSEGHGWRFQLALECLQQLHAVRSGETKGLPLMNLVALLQVDAIQLEPVLEALCELDWVAKISETDADAEPRFVLLADPSLTPLAPLLARLLLPASPALKALQDTSQWQSLRLCDAM